MHIYTYMVHRVTVQVYELKFYTNDIKNMYTSSTTNKTSWLGGCFFLSINTEKSLLWVSYTALEKWIYKLLSCGFQVAQKKRTYLSSKLFKPIKFWIFCVFSQYSISIKTKSFTRSCNMWANFACQVFWPCHKYISFTLFGYRGTHMILTQEKI